MDKKKGTIRHWFQAGWFAFTNGYFRGYTSGKIYTGNTKVLCVPGLNCYSCPGAVGACPIGALQAVIGNPSYRISLYVFGFLALFGTLFGRLICGWMCPFGLVQDLFYKIKVKGKKKNLPGHKYLKYLKYVILAIMVILLPMLILNQAGIGQPWFCEWLCPSGMLLGGIPLTILNEGFRSAIGVRFAWKLIVLLGLAGCATWFYRPFCKYLCPLGAIYGFFNKVSTYRLVIDEEKCIKCGACQRACGMDIKTWETPDSSECIRCGDCMRACPKNAISSTWCMAKEKLVSRCFVDDTETEIKENAVVTNVLFVSILAVIMGIVVIVAMVDEGLLYQYWLRYSLEGSDEIGLYAYIPPMFGLLSGGMLLFTGIYGILGRQDANKVKTLREKYRISLISGILIFVLSAVSVLIFGVDAIGGILGMNAEALGGILGVVIVPPFLMGISRILGDSMDNDGKITKKVKLFILYFFAVLFIAAVAFLVGVDLKAY
ncbi:MAG: 4Fe-4S binding protein [Lachnospiraceae bacterium]|nr:4Fe-4S binding protein [Lachnospiraceae bacterium]